MREIKRNLPWVTLALGAYLMADGPVTFVGGAILVGTSIIALTISRDDVSHIKYPKG